MLTSGVVVTSLALAAPWVAVQSRDPLVAALWQKSGAVACSIGVLKNGRVVAEAERPERAAVYWQAPTVGAFRARQLLYYMPSTGQTMRAHPRSFQSECGDPPF